MTLGCPPERGDNRELSTRMSSKTPPIAARGTTNAVRKEPVCADSRPVIQGSTAAPEPQTANIHPAWRECPIRASNRATARGKIGAQPRPVSATAARLIAVIVGKNALERRGGAAITPEKG